MKPAISLIIPAVNEEKFITAALESVRSQSYPASEIIVVVNGSRDQTGSIAEAWGARVLYFPKMLGFSGARDRGAEVATGDLLVFLDADSTISSVTLEALAARYEERMFGTVLGAPDDPAFIYRFFLWFKNTIHRLRLYRGILGGLFFCEREIFREVGGYPEDYEVDEYAEIITRLLAARGRYTLVTAGLATTSMRRIKKHGIIRPLGFWIFVKLRRLFRLRAEGKTYMTSTQEGD